MECQRCLTGKEAKYRVYTDILDMKVCAACADEARRVGIAVEVLDGGKEKNNGAKSEPKLKDCRLDSWIIALMTDDLSSVSRNNSSLTTNSENPTFGSGVT